MRLEPCNCGGEKLAGLRMFPPRDPMGPYYDLDIGADPEACRAAGGVVTSRIEDHRLIYNSAYSGKVIRIWGCSNVPTSAPAAASAPVTVTSNVQTQVSPQISPIFTQQDEPKNSGVQAGTSQQTGSASFMEYLAAREAQEAEREARLLDIIERGGAAAGASGQSVYMPPPPITYDAASGAANGSVPVEPPSPSSQFSVAGVNPVFALALAAVAAAAFMRGRKKGRK